MTIMDNLMIFVIIAIISTEAFGLSLRKKRQNNEEGDNLEDRYGWDRPQGRPQGRPQVRPNRPFPNGGRQDWPFPNQPWDNQSNRPGRPNQQQWGGQTSDQQWGGGGSRPNQPWDNSNQQNPGQQNPGQQNPGQQNPGQQNPGQQNPGQQNPSGPQTQSPIGSTSQSPDLTACILRCPTTPEYNPVCGSNSVTYSNPGKLTCAQSCGVSVSLQRAAPCPVTTTAAPAPAS